MADEAGEEGEEEEEKADDPLVDLKSTKSGQSGCFSLVSIPPPSAPVLGSLAVATAPKKRAKTIKTSKDAEEDESELDPKSQLIPPSELEMLVMKDPIVKLIAEELGHVAPCLAGLLPSVCLHHKGKVGKQVRGDTRLKWQNVSFQGTY